MSSRETTAQTWKVIPGDTIAGMRTLPDGCVHTCITSPPYWGLRDYGHEGQIGLETTPAAYVARMVEVFREVRRVLRDDGTCWVNLGDSYFGGGRGGNPDESPYRKQATNAGSLIDPPKWGQLDCGLKPKDLCGIPWRVAFALQDDGWYLRQDIIWHKPNPMPESVTDRCTKAHEYLFLLSKSARYYFDADAIAEAASTAALEPKNRWDRGYEAPPGQTQQKRLGRSGNTARKPATERGCPADGVSGNVPWEGDTRNRRSVWTVATQPFPEAHFATFPEALVEPCVKAGCPVGGTVLDPFNGSGTTGKVALQLARSYIGCELNESYVEMSRRRLADVAPLLATEVRTSESEVA